MNDRELVSERQDFQVQRRARPDEEPKRMKQRNKDGRHDSRLSENACKLNRCNAYSVSGTHRGYTRLQGALKNLGHRLARSTIATVLKQHGVPPSEQRPTSWQTFLRTHWSALAAADFFTTEVWTIRGLVTYYTLFVIDLHSPPSPDRRLDAISGRGLHEADRPPRHRCDRRRARRATIPDLRPKIENGALVSGTCSSRRACT